MRYENLNKVYIQHNCFVCNKLYCKPLIFKHIWKGQDHREIMISQHCYGCTGRVGGSCPEWWLGFLGSVFSFFGLM